MRLKNSRTGEEWTVRRHTGNYPGDDGRDPNRSVSVKIGVNQIPFYLGKSPTVNKNGKPINGTRVNFCWDKRWWHITKGDQWDRRNLYPAVEDALSRSDLFEEFEIVD